MRLGERHCCHMLPSWKQKALITVNGSPKPPSTSGEWFQAPKIANLHLHSSCTKDHKGLSLLLVPPGLFFSIYNSCFSHVACILHCFVSFCISALCCCILFLYAFRQLGLGWFVWFFFWRSSFFVFLRICDAQLGIWKVFTEVFAMLSPAQQWTVVRHAWHSNIFSCVIACTQCCVSKGSLCTFKCCVLFPKVVPLIRFIEILQTKTFRLSDWATHARTHKKKWSKRSLRLKLPEPFFLVTRLCSNAQFQWKTKDQDANGGNELKYTHSCRTVTGFSIIMTKPLGR